MTDLLTFTDWLTTRPHPLWKTLPRTLTNQYMTWITQVCCRRANRTGREDYLAIYWIIERSTIIGFNGIIIIIMKRYYETVRSIK